jgi:hypothetical protein
MRKSSFSRAAGPALVAALTLGAFITGAQAARTVKIASHISISGKGLTFRGKVSSTQSACKRGRKVTLYRKESLALGTVTTSAAGSWKITVSGSAGITLGHFYAKASTRSEGTAGTIYVCKAAISKTIAYTP